MLVSHLSRLALDGCITAHCAQSCGIFLFIVFQPISKLFESLVLFVILGVDTSLDHVLESGFSLIHLLKLLARGIHISLNAITAKESTIQALKARSGQHE